MRTHVLAVLWFLLLYFCPLLTYVDPSLELDARTLQVLVEGATVPAVLWGIVRNALALMALPALAAGALAWLGGAAFRHVQRTFRLRQEAKGPFLMLLMTALWIALAGWNAAWFELSNYSALLSSVANPGVLYAATAVVMLVVMVGGATRLTDFLRKGVIRRGAILLGTLALVLMVVLVPERVVERGTRPDVIVLGIDSLSASVLEREPESLPTLSTLKKHGTWFDNAYTPLARTYPAWMALLSGRSPAQTGAIFNLVDMDTAVKSDLVTTDLRRLGYRTVLAFDERRFSALDQSYGFDEVVGPKLGVVDFVVQQINDTPLSNVALQTPLGAWLFPYSHMNVASYVNYDASGFVRSIVEAVRGDSPYFLAAHFLSGHYPFLVRGGDRHQFQLPLEDRYLHALRFVDEQIAEFISELRAAGLLDNVRVYVVSDHGESVGDAFFIRDLEGGTASSSVHGHGVDLLRDDQNRIVLGLVEFKSGAPVNPFNVRQDVVSLMDIRDSIRVSADGGVFGIHPHGDCVLVETGLRLKSIADYRALSGAAVLKEGADFYRINADGVMSLKQEWLSSLAEAKDFGYRCADTVSVLKASGEFSSYRQGQKHGREYLEQVRPNAVHYDLIEAYRRTLFH